MIMVYRAYLFFKY